MMAPAKLAMLFTGGAAAAALSLTACAGGGGSGDPGPEHMWVTEARAEFPTALDLHTKVIARSCGPAQGVCHNTKEFPDLHTAGNLVTSVSRPCNLDLAEPQEVFDGCEIEADRIVVDSVSLNTRIAYLGPDEYDENTGNSFRQLELENAPASSSAYASGRIDRNGQTLANLPDVIQVTAGSKHAKLVNTYMLDYATYLMLETVVGGDPNGNGIFGATDPWAEIVPGHPEKSYLIGRITGTVPGSRMPLANQALSNPEYVAIFCWIESIGNHPIPEDHIDYASCQYAQHPIDYAATP